jgi:hypothetical protein
VPRQHLADPDNLVATIRTGALDPVGHLLKNLRRVGCAGTEDHPGAGMEVANGIHQMEDAFLPRNPTDEEHIGRVAPDVKLVEDVRIASGLILLQVDAVVDHTNPAQIHIVQFVNVPLHRSRHRDHAVGVAVRGPLDPGRDLVRGSQLLRLPRPMRLERMRRQHQRHAGGRTPSTRKFPRDSC